MTKDDLTICLDLGCGERPRGSVNVDLHFHEIADRSPANTKLIPNRIKADVRNLPFPDKTFKQSVCYQVLEHKGVDIVKTLREIERVTINKICFEVPHKYSMIKSADHDKSFTYLALRQFLIKMGYLPKIETKYRHIPKFLALFNIPTAIYVEIML